MEYLAFLLLVVGGAVLYYWRSRRGGSVDDPDRVRQGLPDDLRDKNYGLDSNTHGIRPGGRGR
jgi:hypothetical protein